MSTSSKRRSPASTDVAYARHATPLGEVIFAGTDKGLVGCWFHNQAHFPSMSTWQRDQQHPLLRQAHQQWLTYLKGELKHFDLPLHFPVGHTVPTIGVDCAAKHSLWPNHFLC